MTPGSWWVGVSIVAELTASIFTWAVMNIGTHLPDFICNDPENEWTLLCCLNDVL